MREGKYIIRRSGMLLANAYTGKVKRFDTKTGRAYIKLSGWKGDEAKLELVSENLNEIQKYELRNVLPPW